MPAEMRKRFEKRNDNGCECPCAACVDDDCDDCSMEDCDDPNCLANQERSGSVKGHEHRRKTNTKKVDGENLTADCFLIVGDPEKTDTWHLPWKFSDEDKTKSHLRDALARFDQVEGLSAEEKKAAHAKLVTLCKEHDIDVSDDDKEANANRRLALRVAMNF
jgi:hypothetical protein